MNTPITTATTTPPKRTWKEAMIAAKAAVVAWCKTRWADATGSVTGAAKAVGLVAAVVAASAVAGPAAADGYRATREAIGGLFARPAPAPVTKTFAERLYGFVPSGLRNLDGATPDSAAK